MPKWNVAARFFDSVDARWLDDFIADDNLSFNKIISNKNDNWHSSSRHSTTAAQWIYVFTYSFRAFKGRPDGIITCFPQLAIATAFIKRVTFRKTFIVAYNFNLGSFPSGAKKYLARFSAKMINIFVVHSPIEVSSYSKYLNVDRDRVKFIPLQRAEIGATRLENNQEPYLIAMGSAHRDYNTLIKATESLKITTKIITRKDIADKLPRTDNVQFYSNLSEHDCIKMLAGARLSVIPIDNLVTASGQITVVNSMLLGVALVATRCPGTDGYVEDGVTGMLVEPYDVDDLEQAIANLWSKPQIRERLAQRATSFAKAHLTDKAAATALHKILRDLA